MADDTARIYRLLIQDVQYRWSLTAMLRHSQPHIPLENAGRMCHPQVRVRRTHDIVEAQVRADHDAVDKPCLDLMLRSPSQSRERPNHLRHNGPEWH